MLCVILAVNTNFQTFVEQNGQIPVGTYIFKFENYI